MQFFALCSQANKKRRLMDEILGALSTRSSAHFEIKLRQLDSSSRRPTSSSHTTTMTKINSGTLQSEALDKS